MPADRRRQMRSTSISANAALARVAVLVALAATALVGCQQAPPRLVDRDPSLAEFEQSHPSLAAYLSLTLPTEIKIDQFTQLRSRAGDGKPDMIELLLSAQDRTGDATKLVGMVNVELLVSRLTSPDPLPRRVKHWQIDLSTADTMEQAIRNNWDRFAGPCYRFTLDFPETELLPGDYQLITWVTLPTGEHLTHETRLKFDGSTVPPYEARF